MGIFQYRSRLSEDNLSDDIEKFYREDYDLVMGAGAVGWIWRQIHRLLDISLFDDNSKRIIEVGSGSGQHLRFTDLNFEFYCETDIRNRNSSPEIKKIMNSQFVVSDAQFLKEFEDDSFDALIATCLLVHLNNIHQALENWRRIVKSGGVLSIYVPCEPGMILRLARFFTTRKRIIAAGYNHRYIHWLEHSNSYLVTISILNHVFKKDKVKIRRYPVPFLSWNGNLFAIVTIRLNKD